MQQVQRGTDVVEVIFQRIRDGFAHVAIGREMHDDLDLLRSKYALDRSLIAQIDLMEGGRRRHGPAMTVDQIVDHHGAMPCGDELANTVAADVTGASNNKNVHDKGMRIEWIDAME